MNRVSAKDLFEKDEPIVMVAAYDAPSAEIVDDVADIILIGDSVGNTRLGYEDTLPVTLEESLSHTAAVARGSERAMVVGDMPFASFGVSKEGSAENAVRYLKEAGAQAVKLETPVEGGVSVGTVRRLTELGVPVMGHVGLTPQQVHRKGYRVQGRDEEEADAIVERALELEKAGVFSLVLESVPESLGARVTDEIGVPTIGIGAGRDVDGQVLVFDDLVGLTDGTPSFVKEYADVRGVMTEAVEEFADEVRDGEFPADEHVFGDGGSGGDG
ncbi:MAG: 3-methyl-2-oxobutanoate hydroxymethyltransferase [Halobacteriales archaeon]|nr:3-methyl-2-oxobutanoate hydroxymethyltransferase [Halobacteriales archaeon]